MNRIVMLAVVLATSLAWQTQVHGQGQTLQKSECDQTVSVTIVETCKNAWYVKCTGKGKCGGPESTWVSSEMGRSAAEQTKAAIEAANSCPCPDVSSSGNSIVDNVSFNYLHYASDYSVGAAGGAACGPCGGGSASNGLQPFGVLRWFRSRDMTEISSFGPGNFCNYDTKLHIYPGNPGWIGDLFDPSDMYVRRFEDGRSGNNADGNFAEIRSRAMKSLRLLDSNGQLVADPADATHAEAESWYGGVVRFELFDLAPPPFWTTGQVNNSLFFPGTNARVEIPDHANLDGQAQLSLSFWVKPEVLPATGVVQGLISKRVQYNNQYAYGVFLGDGGKLNVDLDGLNNRFTSTASLTAGQWAHVAVVFDGTQVTAQRAKLYINGVLDKTASETSAVLPDSAGLLRFGQLGGSNTSYFNGQLDEVRIYTRALTGTEVADMHTTPGTGPLDVEGHWLLDETSGYVVADQTGNHPGAYLPNVPDREGRVVQFRDRNGYGTTLSYKTFTEEEIARSPDRRWQIDTVTDSSSRVGTFHYSATQQSGRWVVESIDLPNGEQLEYTYTTGMLGGVGLPDGTQSAILRGTDPASQTSSIEIFDAAATGGHRKKKVYLTNQYAETDGQIYNQSSMLCRMVEGGTGELTYMNVSDSASHNSLIYEGGGKLKEVLHTRRERYFEDDWTFTSGSGYASFAGTIEPTFEEADYPGNTEKQQRGEFPAYTTSQGVRRTYVYDADSYVTKATYTDGTTETWQYTVYKQVSRYKDRLNRVTKFTYDGFDNLLTMEEGILEVGGVDVNQPEHATYEWEYLNFGNVNQFLVSATIDPLGRRTEYSYNNLHLVTEIREPNDDGSGLHVAHTFTYDPAGRLATSVDAIGRTVTYTYDSRDRVTTITYGDTSTEEFTYGTGAAANLLVEQKDRNGNTTTFEYDDAGRLIRQVMAANDPTVAIECVCTYKPGTNLIAECTTAGERTIYTYDYRHRTVATTVQPRTTKLLTTTQTYTNNFLTKTTDPYGRQTYYVYRPSDAAMIRQVQGTVPADTVTDPATITRDLGPNAKYIVSDIIIDVVGQTTKTIDPRGIEHTTAYDSRGRTTTTIEAFGTADAAQTETDYDLVGNVLEVRHARHFDPADPVFSACRTTMNYTDRNLLETQTVAAGTPIAATVAYTYHLDRTQNVTTDARGNDWTSLWSPCCASRQTGSIDPVGAGASAVHDYNGNIVHTQVLQGTTVYKETTTRYDARNRPVARTVWLVDAPLVDPQNPPIAGDGGIPAADGLTTRWTYDDDLDDGVGLDAAFPTQFAGLNLGVGSDGSASLSTNGEGERSLEILDGIGRKVRQLQLDDVGAVLNISTITFDGVVSVGGFGDATEMLVTDIFGNASRTHVDAIRRVIHSVDALGNVSASEFDAVGNVLSFRDPNLVGFDCTFDARSRRTLCTDTWGDTTTQSYDRHGNVVQSTDAKGIPVICEFDARDRQFRRTDRVGGVMIARHDENSNLLRLIDGDANATYSGLPEDDRPATEYVYDERNLRIAESQPGHVAGSALGDPGYDKRLYNYDGAKRLTMEVDQKGDFRVDVYDRADRVLRKEYRAFGATPMDPPVDEDVFTYDAASRMLSGFKGRYGNTVSFQYDDAGRVVSEALAVAGQAYATGREYDGANRTTRLIYPTGAIVDQAFTPRAQLAQISFQSATILDVQYDDGGRETIKTFGNGVVTSNSYRTAGAQRDNLLAGIATPGVSSYDYAYDANKNRTAESIAAPMAAFGYAVPGSGYDAADRLVAWNRSDGLFNQAWTLSKAGDWSTTSINGSAETRTHSDVHEITTVNSVAMTTDPNGSVLTSPVRGGQTYTWDFDRRLTSVTASGGATQFAYDVFGRRIRTTSGATDLVHVHSNSREIATYDAGTTPASPVSQYVFGAYIDELVATIQGPDTYYHHAQATHSVTAITDASGSVVERYAYSAYGKPTILDPSSTTVRTTSIIGNPWLFTGRRWDPIPGFYYYRERYFDPDLGRFLGRDPAGIDGAGSLYAYVQSQPLSAVDPTGLRAYIIPGAPSPTFWLWGLKGALDAGTYYPYRYKSMILDYGIGPVTFVDRFSVANAERLAIRRIKDDLQADPIDECEPVIIVGHSLGGYIGLGAATPVGAFMVNELHYSHGIDHVIMLGSNVDYRQVGPRQVKISILKALVALRDSGMLTPDMQQQLGGIPNGMENWDFTPELANIGHIAALDVLMERIKILPWINSLAPYTIAGMPPKDPRPNPPYLMSVVNITHQNDGYHWYPPERLRRQIRTIEPKSFFFDFVEADPHIWWPWMPFVYSHVVPMAREQVFRTTD